MPRPEIHAKCTFISVFNGTERVYFSGTSVKYATLLGFMLVMLIVLGVRTNEVVRKSAPPRRKILVVVKCLGSSFFGVLIVC